MMFWICQQWKPACCGNMMLVLDVHEHRKQKKSRSTCATNARQSQSLCLLEQPVWCSQWMWCSTSHSKKLVIQLQTDVQENLEDYVRGRITASERILFTKWVGKAWEEISAKKDIIINFAPSKSVASRFLKPTNKYWNFEWLQCWREWWWSYRWWSYQRWQWSIWGLRLTIKP